MNELGKTLKCDFCGSMGSTKACIINGAKATVYDKGATLPRAPAICDECALLIVNMGIRAVKGRLALVESARRVFSMPPANPLAVVSSDGGSADTQGLPDNGSQPKSNEAPSE